MSQELNLDDLANEMRNQQGMGNARPKQLSWNPKTMKFESSSSSAFIPDDHSTLNQGVVGKGWY